MRWITLIVMLLPLMGATCSKPKGGLDANEQRIADGARGIVGTSLIGARGQTPADQDKIDDTVVGLCSTKTWTKTECRRHGIESRPHEPKA